MKKKISPGLLPLCGLFVFFLIAFASCKKNNTIPDTGRTITEIVSNTPDFSILKVAVVKAGLAATLNGTGPFTVFAPNNAAFKASGISMETVNSLSAEELKAILLYHTIGSKVTAANVPVGPDANIATVGGKDVFLTNNSNGVTINGVKVLKADIMASNGVIHVISRVLMPPSGNIVETAMANPNFTYLVAAVVRASKGSSNVAAILSGAGPFTVFAPTNDAFKAAGFPTIEAINAADPNTLTTILTYHVLAGRVFSSDLTNGGQPETVNGEKVTIGLTGGATVKGKSNPTASKITATDIVTTNGVIHVIDQVLLP